MSRAVDGLFVHFLLLVVVFVSLSHTLSSLPPFEVLIFRFFVYAIFLCCFLLLFSLSSNDQAFNDVICVMEAKLAGLGVPDSDLDLEKMIPDNSISTIPAGLVSVGS